MHVNPCLSSNTLLLFIRHIAGVVKLVDTVDSKSAGATLTGSSPVAGINTNTYIYILQRIVFNVSKNLLLIVLLNALKKCQSIVKSGYETF